MWAVTISVCVASCFCRLNWAEFAAQTCRISKHLSPTTLPHTHVYIHTHTHSYTHQGVDWRKPLIHKGREDMIWILAKMSMFFQPNELPAHTLTE